MAAFNVAIVGGGIGGLTLALALRERGVAFEVYEQADELREVGAAVALSANGTRELRRLGLGERVEAVGARWALHDLAPLKRWHTNRVVLLGDAAHAMVPHQGQGANTTIEDAIVLARALATADDAPSALRLYTAIQRRRTTAIQWLARRTADLLHLPDGPEIAARDALFAELNSGLAWIHSYDASQRRAPHADRNPGTVSSNRSVPGGV